MRTAQNPAIRIDPLANALGYKGCTPHFLIPSGAAGLSTQVIYACALWLPPGVTISNVVVHVMVAGAGTSPTGFYVGLCSPTKMLAQSGNLIDGSTQEAKLKAIGTAAFPLSATYTTSYADSTKGIYYGVVLENGAYGGTAVTLAKNGAGGVGNGAALSGQSPIWGTLGTGQTVLTANGNAVTFTENTGSAWAFGVS